MRTKLLGILAALVVATIGVLWGGGTTAMADGGPHTKGMGATTDACAGCHRAHTAKASYLLNAADETSLCYSCHDGTGSSTDVRIGSASSSAYPGTQTSGTGGGLKGGGFEFARLNTTDVTSKTVGVLDGSAAQVVTSAHSIGATGVTVWGSGALGTSGAGGSVDLECTSCHDPHGNTQYRILRPVPAAPSAGGLITATYGTRMTSYPGTVTGGVAVPDETSFPHHYTTGNYWDVSSTTNNYPADTHYGATVTDHVNPIVAPGAGSTEVNLSAWCAQCHQRYLAPSGSYAADSGDAIFTYRHANEGGHAPQCIQCHVSHGTNAQTKSNTNPVSGFVSDYASGVTDPGSTTLATVSGTSRLLRMDNRGVCQKCHNK